MALGVLCILVKENSWIPNERKLSFYLTYGIIALSAFTEWAGVQINGNSSIPSWVLMLVKCGDYILTPLVGGAVVAQMKLQNRWYKILMIVLSLNAAFQIVAVFNNWMTVIDENNNYSHGSLYVVYIVIYLIVLVLTAIEFREYGLTHRKQNRASLYSAFLLVIAGIAIQEIFCREFRTAYVALTFGAALMFIHYSEFYHMSANEHIKSQHAQLMKDALSRVYSRLAYNKALEKYNKSQSLPDNMVVFSIDINGLKIVNDTEGHDAGDKLIIGAGWCIEKAFGNAGKCYRVGGDEFIVLARMSKEQAVETVKRLNNLTVQWSKGKKNKLSLSSGFAFAKDHEGFTVEGLAKKADQAMYSVKADYYLKNGLTRRF